ncbi:MAG: hypothetical protein RIC18_09845 [Hoeflea sp.]|uniref:DUF6916 family protein n=1 Tax=Hoeflea sp. TaxID=1940281 RepID=UPI0032F08EA1
MIDKLTAESFEGLDTQTFTLPGIEPPQRLRLIEVVRKGKGERMGGAFSLLWQSDSDSILPQGCYTFKHDGLGDLDIFIVPVGQASEGVHYEAVFT